MRCDRNPLHGDSPFCFCVTSLKLQRVFGYDASSRQWAQRGEDLEGENAYDQFGYSVSLSGDGSIVAAGAIYNDAGDHQNSGHVRVYHVAET